MAEPEYPSEAELLAAAAKKVEPYGGPEGWLDAHREELGVRLQQAREAAGLTQVDLARRLGVSSTTVSRWERGVQGVKFRDLQAIEGALGVSTSAILGEDAEELMLAVGANEMLEDVEQPLSKSERAELRRLRHFARIVRQLFDALQIQTVSPGAEQVER